MDAEQATNSTSTITLSHASNIVSYCRLYTSYTLNTLNTASTSFSLSEAASYPRHEAAHSYGGVLPRHHPHVSILRCPFICFPRNTNSFKCPSIPRRRFQASRNQSRCPPRRQLPQLHGSPPTTSYFSIPLCRLSVTSPGKHRRAPHTFVIWYRLSHRPVTMSLPRGP